MVVRRFSSVDVVDAVDAIDAIDAIIDDLNAETAVVRSSIGWVEVSKDWVEVSSATSLSSLDSWEGKYSDPAAPASAAPLRRRMLLQTWAQAASPAN